MDSKFDRLTADWISPVPWFAIHYFESAKTDYVNPLAFPEMALYEIKQQIDQT